MSRSVIVAALALLAAPLGAQGTTPPPFKPFTAAETARYTELGKAVTRWFFEGKADSILAISTAETAEQMGGLDGIRRQMDLVAERGVAASSSALSRFFQRHGMTRKKRPDMRSSRTGRTS